MTRIAVRLGRRWRGHERMRVRVPVPWDKARARAGLGPKTLVTLGICLGLATGLIELVLLFVRKHWIDATAVSALQLNPHAMWMVPVSNGVIMGTSALALAAAAVLFRSRLIESAGLYALCFLAAIPLLLTYRGLTTIAYLALAAGITFRVAPRVRALIGRRPRLLPTSLFVLGAIVAAIYVAHAARDAFRADRLPAPASELPNVLLVVLDTVRAESLSLYGYGRPTSPSLERIAGRGIRFDQARTAGAWTLPAHASMFTGRWPHELATRPDRPLGPTYPTLAEFLGNHGYATAGFVGNTYFCSLWYGLGRGFAHYEDVAVSWLETVRSSQLGRILVKKVDPSTCARDRPRAYFHRKDAATVSGDFLRWLDGRPAGRPFFAFLNFFDAHDPYLTPDQCARDFGMAPQSPRDLEILRDWHRIDKPRLPARAIELARDCYDNGIGFLDDQVGRLMGQLEARGLDKNTLVIITADHGELFGEHGVFGHGQNLYHEIARVPLLIVAPGRAPTGRVVTEPVSLRDLPATVVDMLGLSSDSPFPGRSLVRFWNPLSADEAPSDPILITETADEVSAVADHARTSRALFYQGKLYIRGRDGREELYDHETDPAEARDLSQTASADVLLSYFRERMERIDIEAAAAVQNR